MLRTLCSIDVVTGGVHYDGGHYDQSKCMTEVRKDWSMHVC